MLFPNGVTHYIIGGLLIGLSLGLIYIITGIQAGASGILGSALYKITGRTELKKTLTWRTVFFVTTILGGLLYAFIFNDFFTTGVSWWKLLIAGVLVGYGSRAAKGCTSGHGLCGTGSINTSSIIFVILIITFAVLTGWIV